MNYGPLDLTGINGTTWPLWLAAGIATLIIMWGIVAVYITYRKKK